MQAKRLNCPHCPHYLLTPTVYHEVEVDVCLNCGGLWFDHQELEKIILAQEPSLHQDYNIFNQLGVKKNQTQKKCPHGCELSLEEFEFHEKSPLLIDICSGCLGIWLEKEELAHVRVAHQLPQALASIDESKNWGHWVFQFFLNLPIEFNIKPRRTPWVTYGIIIVNVLIFLLELIYGVRFFDKYELLTAHIGSDDWMFALVSYQFIHLGWSHLLGNLYFIYILGDNIEDTMSPLGFLAFYLFLGMMAGIFESMFHYDTLLLVAGASGSIAGLMAAYLFWFRRAKLTVMLIVYQIKLHPIWYFSIWLGWNLLGLALNQGGIAWMTHIGGFISGLFLAYLMYPNVLKNFPLLALLNKSGSPPSRG